MKHKYIWINYEKDQYLNSVDFDEPVNIKGYYRPGGNWPLTNLRTDLTNGNQTIVNGAFSISMETVSLMISSTAGSAIKPKVMEFDASKSNAIYGNSTIVQPPAVCVNIFILMK